MGSVYITRIASFLPNAPVGNDDMERILGQTGPRPSRVRRTILRHNGIVGRHYAIDPVTLEFTHTNAGLTAEAIRRLADDGNRDGELRDGESPDGTALPAIDCLATGTTVSDQIAPNHAQMVQGELALPACEAVATSGICLSGMSAFRYACLGVAGGVHRRAVASGSELSSAVLRAGNLDTDEPESPEAIDARPELAFEKDFLRWMLSDGAGAVLLEANPDPTGLSLRVDWVELVSFAGEMETCMYCGALKQADGSLRGWSLLNPAERRDSGAMAIQQDVKLLNEHVMDYTVYHALGHVRARHDIAGDDYDWFLPHYSSQYFRAAVAERMERAGVAIPQERWFTNLATKGNTGAASIYIMLAELFHSDRLQAGQRILGYIPESGRFASCFVSLTVVGPDGGANGSQ